MALINSRAQLIEDDWNYPDAQGGGAIRPNHVLPLDALADVGPETSVGRPIGAYVAAGVMAHKIVPLLNRLGLVAVEFPKFRDGRGFTVARALRERHGFRGDIRAVGHVLPDQFAALVQCGFSTIVTPPEHLPEQWQHVAPSAHTRSAGGPLLQRLIGRRARSAPARRGKIMTRLPLRTIDDAAEVARELLVSAEKRNGFLPNLLRVLANAPSRWKPI
jgi:uncharacterized protein (DUF934 family)